jgi:lipopolysaccharide transport system permease protein
MSTAEHDFFVLHTAFIIQHLPRGAMSSVSTNGVNTPVTGVSRREPLVKIRPPHGWAALDLSSVWKFRDLLMALASRDVKLRYKQTALGIVWVLLQPLMAAGVFTFVFGSVAGMAKDQPNYFLFSYSGLLAWNLFNNTVGKSSGCLVGNSQLISKIFFPRLVLPFSTLPSALLDFGVAFAMMLVLMVIKHVAPTPAFLLLPVWIALLLMLAAGIGLWTAALTVPYRDVQYMLPVFLNLLMYASPVAYSIDRMSAKVKMVYHLNPLAPIIEGLRWSIMGSSMGTHPPQLGLILYAALFALGILVVGAFVFKRMERKFADVI